MNKKISLVLFVAIFSALFAGCLSKNGYKPLSNSYSTKGTFFSSQTSTLIEANYKASDSLIRGISGSELPDESPLFIDNFTNISSPDEANPFGKVLADQLRQRFIQKGFNVKAGHARNITPDEVKRMTEMRKQYFKEKQKSAFATEPPRPAVLTGSYALGNNEVYVSAELIRIDDGTVISGHNWTIPATDDVRRFLLREQQFQGLTPSTGTSLTQ